MAEHEFLSEVLREIEARRSEHIRRAGGQVGWNPKRHRRPFGMGQFWRDVSANLAAVMWNLAQV